MSSNRLPLSLAAPLLALLAGCAADLAQQDERLSHPIAVELRSLHAIVLRTDPSGFTAAQQDQLRHVAGEAQRRAAGAMTVSGGDPAWTHRVAEQLRSFGAIDLVEEADGSTDAVTIDVPVWTARAPECGTFERGLNPDYDNAPHSNWGCSIQRNIAAMVQNPADLMRARTASGRDAARGLDVLDKYTRGLGTSSDPDNSDKFFGKSAEMERPQ